MTRHAVKNTAGLGYKILRGFLHILWIPRHIPACGDPSGYSSSFGDELAKPLYMGGFCVLKLQRNRVYKQYAAR